MYQKEIPNWMLYELLQNQQKMLERLESRFDRIERKVDEIYINREKVQIDFSRRLLLGTGLLSGIISFIIALFTGSFIVRTN